jgi:hypothetical protein
MADGRRVINILWPSFLVAIVAEGVFFTLVDPAELSVFGEPPAIGRMGVYTVGFFGFWLITAASSALTCFFQRSAPEVSRLPADAPGPGDGSARC